jgi:hypothetical protein
MTGFIVSVFLFRNRVSSKEAFEGLELGEGKLSRPVLRGPGGRKAAWLLGNVADTQRAWWEGFVRGYGAGKGGIVSRRRKSALESKTRKDENGFGLAESALVESMPGKVSAAWCSGERDAGRR